jgi:hypothetical protein
MVPSIPRDVESSFGKQLVADINRLLYDFIHSQVPKIAKEQEDKLFGEIRIAQKDGKFLGRIITAATPDTVTLLVRFANVGIPGLEHLKFKLLRGEIEIDRYVNLTQMSAPYPVKIRSIPAFAVQIEQRTDNYLISIGGGVSRANPNAAFNQYRVEIDFKAAPLYLKGLLVQREKGGFLIDVNCRTGICIPLGPGFGLKGVGVLYGEHFAPELRDPGSKETPTERMEHASAPEYVAWAKMEDLEKWAPTDENLRIYGLTASFCDAFTGGKIIMLNEASAAYIDYGPVFVLGGKLAVLSIEDLADVIGAIDCRSKTAFGRASLEMDVIPWAKGAFVVSGVAEVSASLRDQRQTWYAVGGFAMDGCRVKLLKFIELWGGYRIVPLQGSASRGGARLEGRGELLGIGGGYSFGLDFEGHVGWNPVEIGGSLSVFGDAWIEIFGERLGVGASALLAIQVAQPLHLKFELEFRLNLPNPLPDKKFPIKVFDLDDPTIKLANAALDLAAHLPLPHVHWASGATGQIEAAGGKVWPDVSFELPFIRNARGTNIIVNPPTDAGVHDEGGITTAHEITRLEICKVDAVTGAEVVDTSVRASWLMGRIGDGAGNSNRLSIPSSDPLAWLTRFESAGPDTSQHSDSFILQTFGRGPSVDIPIDPGTGLAVHHAERVVATSDRTLRLVAAPWTRDYARGLVGSRLALGIAPSDPAAPVPPITGYQLRLASPWGRIPRLSVNSGGAVASSVELSRLADGLSEWCVEIVRQVGEYLAPLSIGNGEDELRLLAVGYRRAALQALPGPRTVFTPGHYRLHVKGYSESAYRGLGAGRTNWTPIQRDFEVVLPPLRPYLRYATCGDERIFGLACPGWNPNPLGSGFGHYRGHLGLIRSRVGYLSSIFHELWISPTARSPNLIPIRSAREGTIAGSAASQDWTRTAGGAPEIEEELEFVITPPPLAGTSHPSPVFETIRIFTSTLNDGTGSDINPAHPVDEWTYRISRHADSIEHLKPATSALSIAYGPFGSLRLNEDPGGAVPAGLNIPATPVAPMQSGWALPRPVAALAGYDDPKAGLNFLRILEWAGLFHANPSPGADNVLSRASGAELAILLDTGRSPIGILIKIDEPCDWRRVSLDLVVGDLVASNVRFTSRITPGPDGCAAIVMFEASSVPVRIPSGKHALRLTFALEAKGLPRLTRADAPAQKVEQISLTFTQPFGSSWS